MEDYTYTFGSEYDDEMTARGITKKVYEKALKKVFDTLTYEFDNMIYDKVEREIEEPNIQHSFVFGDPIRGFHLGYLLDSRSERELKVGEFWAEIFEVQEHNAAEPERSRFVLVSGNFNSGYLFWGFFGSVDEAKAWGKSEGISGYVAGMCRKPKEEKVTTPKLVEAIPGDIFVERIKSENSEQAGEK